LINVFFHAVYDKYGESGISSCTVNKGHRSHFYPMEMMRSYYKFTCITEQKAYCSACT